MGTPAHGTPGFRDPGTPAGGVPRFVDSGAAARGVPQTRGAAGVRGGHPEQREAGGGWGAVGAPLAGPPGAAHARIPGPRREYLAAFDDDPATADPDPYAAVTAWDYGVPDQDGRGRGRAGVTAAGPDGPDGPHGGPSRAPSADGLAAPRGGKGRVFTGLAAAAVTVVLAVVVAGQAADEPSADGPSGDTRTQAQTRTQTSDADDSAAGSDGQPDPDGSTAASSPDASPAKPSPATYEEKMGEKNPIDPKLKGSGEFEAIGGLDKAPGKGRKFRYRVDVEKGIGLDGELFATAVQKTLNDDRSWAHGGGRTFERISSGKPDFVITLASPGTTGVWCAKSGLDTTQQNVSCDSAATERIMINAYRWAQGSQTYGDAIHAYRQMLINHEVGHRLGFGHVNCSRDGALAPVMQQQTKFLSRDGITCKANPWAYPGR
ncbi:DUF3152 domain-containing protein [Streptomyces sp. O3]